MQVIFKPALHYFYKITRNKNNLLGWLYIYNNCNETGYTQDYIKGCILLKILTVETDGIKITFILTLTLRLSIVTCMLKLSK